MHPRIFAEFPSSRHVNHSLQMSYRVPSLASMRSLRVDGIMGVSHICGDVSSDRPVSSLNMAAYSYILTSHGRSDIKYT